MKFIGPDGGRVGIAYQGEEVRPAGGIHIPSLIDAFVGRYRFAQGPTPNDLQQNQLSFQSGIIGSIAIASVILHKNFLVVQANTTDDAEFFVEDLFKWGSESLGFRPFITPPQRQYVSAIVVDFDAGVETKLAALAEITELLGAAFEGYDYPQRLQFAKLYFSTDPLQTPQVPPRLEFGIERRAETPYEMNRFFCQGPYKTADMIGVMGRVEAALLAAR